jgi:hypothetical protein
MSVAFALSIEDAELARIKMAEKLGCNYVCTVVDSKEAQKVFEQKLGFKTLRELKLTHFMDGKKPAFCCKEVESGKLLCKKL